MLRQIDTDIEMVGRSLQAQQPRTRLASIQAVHASAIDFSNYNLNQRHASLISGSVVTPVIAASVVGSRKNTLRVSQSLDMKHDTRFVNEAFQDAVVLLEEGFYSKMQAEMLVLVDVLHKPASIFPASSTFRTNGQDRHFIGKLVLLFSLFLIHTVILKMSEL
jgi:hypothetical protein